MSDSAWSVDAIARDRSHGSTYLSIRALEILGELAGAAGCTWSELRELARELVHVRPSMVVIANRIHRTMHAANADVSAVEREARAGIESAKSSDDGAAANAAELIRRKRVFTLSRSETVTDALLQARPPWVGIAESRPGSEGSVVAERLRQSGIAVTVFPDAAMAAAIVDGSVEVVLVGADALLPSGTVINKVGTRLLALAAAEQEAPMYAACAEDKVSPDEELVLEPADATGVPLFEPTPPRLLEAIITENGIIPPESASGLAQRLRGYRGWMEGG